MKINILTKDIYNLEDASWELRKIGSDKANELSEGLKNIVSKYKEVKRKKHDKDFSLDELDRLRKDLHKYKNAYGSQLKVMKIIKSNLIKIVNDPQDKETINILLRLIKNL